MKKQLKLILDNLKRNFSKKSSEVGTLMACGTVGNPIWTPRRYESLAEEGYQKNVIVYRCVNLIARGIGSVPWLLYREDVEVEEHPLLDLLNAPNPRQAGSAFMEAIVGHLLLAGNAYIEATLNHDGHPCELYSLRPDRMKIIPGSGGIPTGYEYSVAGQRKVLQCNPITGRSWVLQCAKLSRTYLAGESPAVEGVASLTT
jgi:HK97 family phage portal protein